ncbi:hypothetical protein ACHAXR_010847 [Thalassiosira sp. AJA248-18]
MDFSTLTHSALGVFLGGSKLALFVTVACVLAPPICYLYRYRSSIKKRVKEIEKNVSLVKVVRNKSADLHENRVICMELDPSFVKENSEWRMMSLGEYLSQLEPAEQSGFNHLFLQTELEITIGKFLLDTLGKTYGAALLPILGAGSVASSIAGLSNKISKFISKCILSDDSDASDPMSFDLSLMEVVSFVNLYQKVATQDSGPSHITPLDYLSRGENAAGDLAYDLGDETFPNTFDLGDFEEYVTVMEERILEKEGKYDPDDRSLPPPTPINERLLPQLYLGKGDLKYTHTKKEGIEHRLLCVLLNKLCYNYYKLSQKGTTVEDCFKVVCNGKQCLFPEELIQGLVDCGHKVEVCPRMILTNFGMALCVKEDDGSFTYIPTAVMLRTGIERTTDSKPAYFAAPHGGMDLNISGPLIGKGTRPAWLQFYVSIGGLTCFHPDEDQDAPWAAKTSLSDVYSPDDAIRAIRMCAVVAITFNRIATEFSLPFGGYGILGMCNDSSTLVDFALRGKTNSYPLLSTGRYLNHIVSYLHKLKTELSEKSPDSTRLQPVINDIVCLIKSTCQLPSDLHISVSSLIGTSERYDTAYANSVFQSTADAKAILHEMANTAKEYLE